MVKVSNWTEKEVNYLIKWWHRKSNKKIGVDLNKSESNVQSKSEKVITFDIMRDRKWSEYELNLVQKLYGTMDIEKLSNRMKRTKQAIINKVRELEGTTFVPILQPVYSTPEIGRFLGMTQQAVHRRIKNGDIPCYYANEKMLVIREDVFWKWASENLHIPKYKNITDDAELDSPDWYRFVIKQKKKELANSNNGKPWSSKDDALLKFELTKKTPRKQIAEMLGRSYDTVNARVQKLNKLSS